MKRLFEVNGEFFASKKEAKVARGEPVVKAKAAEPGVIGSKNEPAQYKFEIKLGPDHWKRGGGLPGAPVPKPAAKRTRKKAAAEVTE